MRAHIIICNSSIDRGKNKDSSDIKHAIPNSKKLDLLPLELNASSFRHGLLPGLAKPSCRQKCIQVDGEQIQFFRVWCGMLDIARILFFPLSNELLHMITGARMKILQAVEKWNVSFVTPCIVIVIIKCTIFG